MTVPDTSISMLKDLAGGAESVRWTEFHRRYGPVMRSYLQSRFPSVDPDDTIQETMLTLMRVLPDYRYVPDSKGHFRNWLVGIVRHKALDALRATAARERLATDFADNGPAYAEPVPPESMDGDDAWCISAMEAALEQVLADTSIAPRTREVFRHAVLMREKPEDVARMFGTTRNNVDQIKARMTARLAKLAGAMAAARTRTESQNG